VLPIARLEDYAVVARVHAFPTVAAAVEIARTILDPWE
jgi:hypothetical protein